MKIKLFLCIVMVFLLAGCNGYKEPEKQYIVTTLGFKTERKSFSVCIKTKSNDDLVQAGIGNDLNSAVESLLLKTEKPLSYGHCKLILVSPGIASDTFADVLEYCAASGVPLNADVAYCESIISVMRKNINISALVDRSYESFGFGGHTALFEIRTAILTNSGNFALPHISATDDAEVYGMCRYENSMPKELLGIEESIRYAKKQGVFGGGKTK